MSPIDLPDLDQLTTRGTDSFRGALPDDDVSPTSDNFKRVRVNALANLQLNHHIQIIVDDLLADKSSGAELERLGNIYGVPKKGATPARKEDALRVVGTAASTVSIGDLLTSSGGLTFQVNENAVVPAAEFIDVDIIGVDVGTQTRLKAKEVLVFNSPPAGIEAEAELQLDLDEDGTDEESDPNYRTRILNRLQQPAAGGNANDYVNQFALPQEGVETAFVYPLRGGRGSVDLAVLHAGTGVVRVFTLNERNTLKGTIDVLRPVSMKSFRILETTTLVENVEITIVPLTDLSFQFDWDDSTAPIVSSWEPGGAERTIRFTLDRPTDMLAGDRIVIRTAAGDGSGELFEIESLPGTLTDIVINRTPSPVPVATDVVFSGGPLTDPIRDAILALIDRFGPARGLFADGDFQSDLVPAEILATAFTVDGVRNGTVITPASTIVANDPVFPLDATIELIIPGEIIVRNQ